MSARANVECIPPKTNNPLFRDAPYFRSASAGYSEDNSHAKQPYYYEIPKKNVIFHFKS